MAQAAITRIDDPTNDFVASAGGPDSASGGLWGNAPLLAATVTDPKGYIYYWNDFFEYTDEQGWTDTQYNATGSVAHSVGASYGAILVDSGAAAADDGIQIQSDWTCSAPAADESMFFEARFKVTDTLPNAQLFIGLASDDTSVLAAGVVTPADFVGFVKDTASIAVDADAVYPRSSSGTAATGTAITLVEDTFVTLGFRMNGVSTLDVFKDGEFVETIDISGTNVAPEAAMKLTLACAAEANTSDPILTVDYLKFLGYADRN